MNWGGYSWKQPLSCLENKRLKTHKSVTLPVVLYRCETLFLTSRDEHRKRVSKIEVLRGMFSSKKGEITKD